MLLMKAVMASMQFIGFATGNVFGGASSLGGNLASAALSSVEPFAEGGTFTNQVVSAITAFRFNHDGRERLGVMGEAGPEAIMPLIKAGNAMAIAAYAEDGTKRALALTRGPGGALGVRLPEGARFFATGGVPGGGPLMASSRAGGGGGGMSIHAPVEINFTSSGDPTVDAQAIVALRKSMVGLVDERIGLALRRVAKPGGQNNIFGMKPV
jgi:hypothetical protein